MRLFFVAVVPGLTGARFYATLYGTRMMAMLCSTAILGGLP